MPGAGRSKPASSMRRGSLVSARTCPSRTWGECCRRHCLSNAWRRRTAASLAGTPVEKRKCCLTRGKSRASVAMVISIGFRWSPRYGKAARQFVIAAEDGGVSSESTTIRATADEDLRAGRALPSKLDRRCRRQQDPHERRLGANTRLLVDAVQMGPDRVCCDRHSFRNFGK